uniref:Secreted protein n=1 Tax=Lygus hesperus TaxID=30085 RepID=A0A146KLK0_LYGHE
MGSQHCTLACSTCTWHTLLWSPTTFAEDAIVCGGEPQQRLHRCLPPAPQIALQYPVQRLDKYPSVLQFSQYYVYLGIPCVLHRYAQHWPAVQSDNTNTWSTFHGRLWGALYNRYVPVEFGTTYLSPQWTKKIVKGA